MEDTSQMEVTINRTATAIKHPCYCLKEAINVFLKCLGFDDHGRSSKSDQKINSNSSSSTTEKDEPSGQESSSNTGGEAADPPSTLDPPADPPAISAEEAVRSTSGSRPTRPPINAGSGPSTN